MMVAQVDKGLGAGTLAADTKHYLEIDVASDISAGLPQQRGLAAAAPESPPASAFLITLLTIGVGVLVAICTMPSR